LRPDFKDLLDHARNRKVLTTRHQIWLFTACLVISFFLWALVRLSKTYYYAVDYRLNYTQVPENFYIARQSDSVLTIQLRVQGYDFLTEKYFVNRDHAQEVSLRRVRVHYRDHMLSGYLLTDGIVREITSKTLFPMEIVTYTPDTLFFQFERKKFRPEN
jgi:hypothetical protein